MTGFYKIKAKEIRSQFFLPAALGGFVLMGEHGVLLMLPVFFVVIPEILFIRYEP